MMDNAQAGLRTLYMRKEGVTALTRMETKMPQAHGWRFKERETMSKQQNRSVEPDENELLDDLIKTGNIESYHKLCELDEPKIREWTRRHRNMIAEIGAALITVFFLFAAVILALTLFS